MAVDEVVQWGIARSILSRNQSLWFFQFLHLIEPELEGLNLIVAITYTGDGEKRESVTFLLATSNWRTEIWNCRVSTAKIWKEQKENLRGSIWLNKCRKWSFHKYPQSLSLLSSQREFVTLRRNNAKWENWKQKAHSLYPCCIYAEKIMSLSFNESSKCIPFCIPFWIYYFFSFFLNMESCMSSEIGWHYN